MMTSANAILLAAMLCGFLTAGCTEAGKLRPSTEASSSAQLEAARHSGFPTEIIAEDEELDTEQLLSRQAAIDPEVTYLLLTRTDAQIVWGSALREDPPVPEGAILGPWVAPYLKFGDRDNALKAFVFGYLSALNSAGRIEWDSAIVPFLPPQRPRPVVENTYGWGLPLALLMAFLTAWSARERRRLTPSSPVRGV